MGRLTDTELSLDRLERAEAELQAAKAKVSEARATHRYFLSQVNLWVGQHVTFGGRKFIYTGDTDGLVEVKGQPVRAEGAPGA